MNDQEFRRRLASVRIEFAESYKEDPERALEVVSELLRTAIRMDADHYFGLTDSTRPMASRPSRRQQ